MAASSISIMRAVRREMGCRPISQRFTEFRATPISSAAWS